MLLDDFFFKWKRDSYALMSEDYLYLGSFATFCHWMLAHICLGLVIAMLRKTWCPMVSPLDRVVAPFPTDTCKNQVQRGAWPYLTWQKQKANPPDLFLRLFEDFRVV